MRIVILTYLAMKIENLIEKELSQSCVQFLIKWFFVRSKDITLEGIVEISEDELIFSCLSMVSVIELIKYQEKIKRELLS